MIIRSGHLFIDLSKHKNWLLLCLYKDGDHQIIISIDRHSSDSFCFDIAKGLESEKEAFDIRNKLSNKISNCISRGYRYLSIDNLTEGKTTYLNADNS